MIQFKNSNIFLVTGASTGIGRSICHTINKLDGTIIAVARNIDNLQEMQNSASSPERIFLETIDLSSNLEDLPSKIDDIVQKYGKLQSFIYSAGICEKMPFKIHSTKEAYNTFNINFFSALELARGFIKKKNNTAQNSSIIFISSISGKIGQPALLYYGASKAAMSNAVESLASEVVKSGIRVNGIMPAHINTNMFVQEEQISGKEYIEQLKKSYPLGIGNPEDVANLCCFLISKQAKWITGQNYILDGGFGLAK